MCGFAGIISSRNISYSNILKMTNLLKHRGPDDIGVMGVDIRNRQLLPDLLMSDHADVNGAVGFRRLSIRDLSMHGRQPMVSGKVAVSFVGEIYNSDEMKRKLEKHGIIFRGTSDTEAVLKWYELFGIESLLDTLNGMYAIVIFDLRINKAYLFRDRLGIKPLYYYFGEDVLVYASEIKAICESGYYRASLNEQELGEHLLFRSPGTSVLFKDIRQINPGELLIYDFLDGSCHWERWFSLNSYTRLTAADIREEEALRLLKNSLEKAVCRQLISDVNVGIQLSGGIDSGVIAGLARKQDENLQTFSTIIDMYYYSEEDNVRKVNRDKESLMNLYRFTDRDFLSEFEKVIWHLESLNNHPNALGFYFLTKKAKNHVSVLLSGEGADELMGGYRQFADGMDITSDYEEFAVLADRDCSDLLMKQLFPDIDFERCIRERKRRFRDLQGNNFEKHIKYELMTYLPDLLMKQDRMAMANSLENRVPYLDYEFVDTVMKLPAEYLLKYSDKTKKIEGKYLLKRLASELYGVRYGFQKKKGFPMPIQDFMKRKEFRGYIQEMILPGMTERKWADADLFHRLWNYMDNRNLNEVKAIWKIINLEVWAQLFLDKRPYLEIEMRRYLKGSFMPDG